MLANRAFGAALRSQTTGGRRLVTTLLGGSTLYAATTNEKQDGLAERARGWAAAAARCTRTMQVGVSIMADYRWSLRSAVTDGLPDEALLSLKSQIHRRSAEKLLTLARLNGGVYIKFGQHLSALVYLVPAEYCQVLRALQDDCTVTPRNEIDLILEEELGEHPSNVFSSFSYQPVGSASLAQVHQAFLTDGSRVAVKIQHPDIQLYAQIDMDMTSGVVRVAKFLFPEFELGWLADEMRANLPREIDFKVEAANSKRMATLLLQHEGCMRVPTVKWATTRVLCMDFVDGARIDDTGYLVEHGIDPKQVSRAIHAAFNQMIFVDGFLHCDPHPGNMFVQANSGFSKGFVVYLLDHGLYRELSDDFRTHYAAMWIALASADEEKIKECSSYFGGEGYHRLFSSILTARSWSALTSPSANYEKRSEEEIHTIQANAQQYAQHITELLSKIPGPLLLVLKTNDLLRLADQALTESSAASQAYNLFETLILCHKVVSNSESSNLYKTLRAGGSHWWKWESIQTRFQQFKLSCQLFIQIKVLHMLQFATMWWLGLKHWAF